jgi:hypothetical protein
VLLLLLFELDTLDRLLRRPRGEPTVAESRRNLLPKDLDLEEVTEGEEEDDDGELLSGLLRDSRFNSDDDLFWVDGGSSGRGFMEERR